MASHKLLVAEDDPGLCGLIRDVGEMLGMDVRCVDDEPSFVRQLAQFEPELVYLDLALRDSDALALIKHLIGRTPEIPVILSSGSDGRALHVTEQIARARGLTIQGVLPKPYSVEQLRAAFRNGHAAPTVLAEEELAHAIDLRQFGLHYQPKVELATLNLIGFEGLARWFNPRLGTVMPNIFLPAIEKLGLESALTHSMLEQAIVQCAEWNAAGLRLSVAVNVWPKDLMSTKVAERIDEMLRLHGVAPGQLTLEHVERDTTRGGIEGAEAYTRLRLKGLNLALDDFGTGYSSLAELWRMPFNELKIDRMFVAAMLDNAEARAIVKAIIELAHALKMKAVAEGVENVEGLRLLHKLGCDIAQGYVFARPMDAASVATWVRDATPLTYSLAS